MLKLAEEYEKLLALLNYRPNSMRLLVLRVLCSQKEFTDLHELNAQMVASGIHIEKEKIRMILKRLNESGFLERKSIPGQNKFLFRLKEIQQLEQEVRSGMNNKHQ